MYGRVPIPDIDKRARRTRDALARALMELVARKPADSITVQELVRCAGIGRSTFYGQFSSLGAFLAGSYAGMLARNAQRGGLDTGGREQILAVRYILEHVHGSRNFVAAISGSRERPRMLAAGQAQLRVIAERNLERISPGLPPQLRRKVATFVAGGFMALLQQWMESGLREPPDEVERAYQDLSNAVLKGLTQGQM